MRTIVLSQSCYRGSQRIRSSSRALNISISDEQTSSDADEQVQVREDYKETFIRLECCISAYDGMSDNLALDKHMQASDYYLHLESRA